MDVRIKPLADVSLTRQRRFPWLRLRRRRRWEAMLKSLRKVTLGRATFRRAPFLRASRRGATTLGGATFLSAAQGVSGRLADTFDAGTGALAQVTDQIQLPALNGAQVAGRVQEGLGAAAEIVGRTAQEAGDRAKQLAAAGTALAGSKIAVDTVVGKAQGLASGEMAEQIKRQAGIAGDKATEAGGRVKDLAQTGAAFVIGKMAVDTVRGNAENAATGQPVDQATLAAAAKWEKLQARTQKQVAREVDRQTRKSRIKAEHAARRVDLVTRKAQARADKAAAEVERRRRIAEARAEKLARRADRQTRKVQARTEKLALTMPFAARQRRGTPLGLWLLALGTGAALVYFLDPDAGSRRRAVWRDKLTQFSSGSGEWSDWLNAAGRDLNNRARGLAAQARMMSSNEPVTDEVLAERVRAQLGRLVSHPGSIDVSAQGGQITLSGPILAREEPALVARVAGVPGVAGVQNHLEVHEEPGNVPGLQGNGKSDLMTATHPGEWTPGIRLLAGLAGGLLTLTGLRSGSIFGLARGVLGLGLLARGATNKPIRSLLGMSGDRPGFEVQRTITVNAPVREVFEFWRHYENFPQFMSHVIEVRDLGHWRSHWTVEGPAGSQVSWDAVTTRLIPDETLAWHSEPGATLENSGRVQFRHAPGGGTQIDVHMSYNPPAGALGQAAAAFFGSDPASSIDEDLARFKALIEKGRTTAKDRTVTKEEVRQQNEMGSGGA